MTLTALGRAWTFAAGPAHLPLTGPAIGQSWLPAPVALGWPPCLPFISSLIGSHTLVHNSEQ